MQFLRAFGTCFAWNGVHGILLLPHSHRVHACTMSSHLTFLLQVMIGTVLKSTLLLGLALRLLPGLALRLVMSCALRLPMSCALRLLLGLALQLLLSCALRLLLGLALRLLLGLSLRLLISLALCFLPRARGQLRAGLRHRCAPLSRFSLANKISDGSAAPRLDSRSPPRTDELSDPQARTQARKLHTENRIRFACLA